MNFKRGFRRIIKVVSVICSIMFVLNNCSGFANWVFTEKFLFLTVGIIIAPVIYYAYIGLEKVFLWIKKGFEID